MKKIQIMLMSLLVLVVVGGILAFKIKLTHAYCTMPALAGTCPDGLICPNLVLNKMAIPGDEYCITTPRAGAAAGKECRTSDSDNAAYLYCITPTVFDLEDAR